MNKKVFISMLVLTMVFLVGLYVAKIFFPAEFMMSIQSENAIKLGSFIDNRQWLFYIFLGITAFITYWLFLCACSHRYFLKWYECLYIVATVIVNRLVYLYVDANALTTAISMASFWFLPALTKGKTKTTAIVFTVHILAQALSLNIRSLPMYLTTVNSITTFCLGFESYLWLILFYIIFNYNKKENKNNGTRLSTTLR